MELSAARRRVRSELLTCWRIAITVMSTGERRMSRTPSEIRVESSLFAADSGLAATQMGALRPRSAEARPPSKPITAWAAE